MNDYIYMQNSINLYGLVWMQCRPQILCDQMLSMEVMLHCYQNLTIFACDINESSLDKTPN